MFTVLAAQVGRASNPILPIAQGSPRGVLRALMGYALLARGIFAPAQKCRMCQSRSTYPQSAALGYVQHLGLQPAPIIYRAFVQIWFIYMHLFLTFSSAAWHSPNKLGLCARHAQTFTIAWLPLYVLLLAYPLRSLRRIFFAKPLKIFPMPVIVSTICAENVCYKVSNTYYKLCNAC